MTEVVTEIVWDKIVADVCTDRIEVLAMVGTCHRHRGNAPTLVGTCQRGRRKLWHLFVLQREERVC